METRLSSKNLSKNYINPNNQFTPEESSEISEEEQDPYPSLSAKTQAQLKAWKGVEILSENPLLLCFPSDEAFCAIPEDDDPGLSFVWSHNLPGNVKNEIANCCESFWMHAGRIGNYRNIAVQNIYTAANRPLSFVGQFRIRSNIDMLLNRLHDPQNLPALTGVRPHTWLGEVTVSYSRGMRVRFSVSK